MANKKIKHDKLALEDTMRLIGELNAIHNHLKATLSAEYDPQKKEDITFVDNMIVQERRKYSIDLQKKLELDEKLYCVVCKHLPTAIILAGEVDGDTEMLYAALASLTGGMIEPCVDCQEDKELKEGE